MCSLPPPPPHNLRHVALERLAGSVDPASGWTVLHHMLATTVSIPLFQVELAEFVRQAGASPTKQIVLVLDRADWHTSVHL
jgi:hypothetical protein